METWLVISNCHTQGIANSIRLLKQDVQIHPPDLWEFRREMEKYQSSYSHYDRVMLSPDLLTMQEFEGFDFSATKKLSLLPTFFFAGYHPDSTFIFRDGAAIVGALDVYHSAIAVSAFNLGLNVDDAARLFRGDVYDALGYFHYWDHQRNNLVKRFDDQGIDIRAAFLNWSRGKSFMHSVDHPDIDCIYDVVRLAMRRDHVDFDETGLVPYDILKHPPKFAVYPEIGERLGVSGNYWFKATGYTTYNLRQFLSASFEVYKSLPEGGITLPAEKAYVQEKIAEFL